MTTGRDSKIVIMIGNLVFRNITFGVKLRPRVSGEYLLFRRKFRNRMPPRMTQAYVARVLDSLSSQLFRRGDDGRISEKEYRIYY